MVIVYESYTTFTRLPDKSAPASSLSTGDLPLDLKTLNYRIIEKTEKSPVFGGGLLGRRRG